MRLTVGSSGPVKLLHLHVGPQWQTSPHWHEAAGWAARFWQPQLHSEPGQTVHAQTFDWVVMRSSFFLC